MRASHLAALVAALAVAVVALHWFRDDGRRLEAEIGAGASCEKAGPEVVIGERETTYNCTLSPNGGGYVVCTAMIDGDVHFIRLGTC